MKNFTSFQSINKVKRAVMTNIAPFNKRVWTLIAPMLFVAFGLFGVNENAWGGNVTLKATAESYPSEWGYVYVSKSNSAPSSYSLTSDYADETKYSAYFFGYQTVSQDFYLFAGPKDGYAFKYWSKSSSATSGDSANPKKVTVSGEKSGTVTDGPYYAIFGAVTVNSATNPAAISITEPSTKEVTVSFTVTSGAKASDFNTPTVSGAGWAYVANSLSVSGTTATVKVNFTATNTTTQGARTGTVKLTSKESGGSNKTANLTANVDLTPHLSANPTEWDFGMFTIGVDSEMRKEIPLTIDANAIYPSLSSGHTPFEAFVSDNHQTLVVKFNPKEVGEWTKTVTVTFKNNQSKQISTSTTITLKGAAQSKTYPTYTCNIENTYMVDDAAIDLQSLWTSTSDGAITYTIEQFTPSGSNNGGATPPAISSDNRYLSLGQAGTVELKLTQAGATSYFASSATKTITINKYETSFDGSSYNLMVDGTKKADYTYTNTSAAQPTANSSDAFYYSIDNVSYTNSAKNYGTNLVTFNPADKLITACNAGTCKITLHQKETYKYTGATTSFDVAVYKFNSAFANAADLPVKVDAEVQSNYTLTYSKPNSAYIGDVPVAGDPTENSGDYYYTLTQNVTSDNTTDSPDATIAAAYNAGTRKATGKNAGTCTVRLYQKETYKFNAAADVSFVVTVTKNEPTFTWKAGPYYHNTTVNNIFTSSNTDFAYTMGASTDAQVAYISGSNLIVLSKNGSAKFTVTQGANYKWSGKSATYTVTPENPSNHVTFTYTQAMYNDGSITTTKSSATGTEWTSSGVRLGGSNTALVCSESTNWDDKYIDIKFLGIPEKVTFKIAVNSSRTTGDYWYVKESANGSTWSDEKWSSEHNGTSFSGTQTVNLSSSTRYIRLCYSGNYAGYFKDVTVHELKKFTPNPTELDFGTLDINTTGAATQKTFEFNYANVGHNVTLSTNDSHFTVSPTSITNIGGEKTGKVTITVNYSTAEVHKNTNAKLTITDELSNSTNVTLTGETKKLTPTVEWKPDASIFNVEDVLSATNENGLAVTLSVASADEAYVACSGNTATMIDTKSGTVTVTAHVTGNNIYADAEYTKDITITNKTKQSISWDNGDFSRLKTTDANKTIPLDATASSHLPVSYKLEGDATGLTLNHSGDVWTLTYSATECKNTTIVAMQEGNEEYAPAPNFSLPVKVIDPTKVCDVTTTVVNSGIELKNTEQSINIDIPDEITIAVKRTNTEWYATYLQGFKVEFYSGKNGSGNQIGATYSYSASDINTSKTITVKNLNRNIKSVKLISEALLGYTVTNVTYKQQKYCEASESALNFTTNPNTLTSAQTFTVNYANYPISLECANNKFTISPKDFGDCGDKGTQTVSVTYTAGAAEGADNGNILYIKDNTGKTLQTCTLNVTISKVPQSITSHTIANTYHTTDRVVLSAETNSDAAEKHFSYSATPAGIASFDGNVMTFSQSGTIAITVREEGSDVYKPCSTTVANVVVNKVTPTLVLPTGINVTYLQNLSSSLLSGGKATVTLRDVPNTEIDGEFTWNIAQANSAEGSGSYEVTFKPSNTGMYTNATGTVGVTVAKANQSIVMNDGTVNVAVDKGIDANSADSKLDLTSLIASQTIDPFITSRTGAVSFEVISANAASATISGTIFSASASGVYTIRATKASTTYYNAAADEFTVTAYVRTNSLGIAGACSRYVGQEVENVLVNVNSDGEIHSSSTAATIAYYDKENNKIVIPNSEAKSFNDTVVTITIWQDANAQFAAAEAKTIEVTVKKYNNQIYKSWATWSQTLNFDQKMPIRLWSDNSETALEITQTGDASIATYYAYPSSEKDTIRAWYNIGTTTWSVSQAETYKYKAATAKTLTVRGEALSKTNDCYVLNDSTEYELHTIATGKTLALDAPGDSLYFEGRRTPGSLNQFFIEYSTNGAQFAQLGEEINLQESYTSYAKYGPIAVPEGTTHIRFKTTTGASLVKYYTNIRVTRKKYFDIEDKEGAKISSMDMPLNIVSNDPINVNSSKKSFYIDYNTCDDEIHIASNHPYYTIKETDKVFSASATDGKGRREIEVTYTCATSDTSSAVISVYTKYDHKTITINGRTDKGTQELIWKKPDFESETVSLPVGYMGIAATASSGLPVTYSIQQDEDSVIRIADDKYSFEVVGEGTAHLTVTQEGTETLFPVTGTRTIIATGKKLQMIKWFQDLTNSLTVGDTVRLEAEVHVMNPKTGVYAKDNARTSLLQYTCPENNGKIEVFGSDSLRVIGTGDTYLTASVDGDDFYVAAASITMPIHIRSLSDTCENILLVDIAKEQTFEPDIDWGLSDWTPTKATYGDTILIDQSIGKPDKLSFMHMGDAFVVPVIGEFYQGYIKAQQRIRGAWEDVASSRVAPTKGVWNELKNIKLDEDADAILIMREQGAYGYHHVKDIKITMLPYLRAEETIVISTEVGATVDTTITLQYANTKAALMAETARKENNVFTVRNAFFYPNCGTMGTYNWPVRFTPMVAGDWLDTVTIKDSGTEESIVIYIEGHAKPGTAFIYQTDETNGVWGDDGNWGHNGALPTENDHVIIRNDVTIPTDTTVYVKSLTIEETATLKVNGTLVVMESTPDKYSYGNIHVKKNGYVDLHNINVGGLKVNDFILDAALGGVTSTGFSGQVESAEKLVVNGDAYFQMTLNPSGSNTLGWYDFVVPFEVEVMGGISIAGDNTPLVFNDNYAVMNYSEAKRAEKGKDWNKFRGTMEPGKVYTIAVDAEHPEWNTVLFKKKDGVSITGDRTYTTEYSSAIGEVKDRGWNGFGNGTLRHAKLDFNEGDDTKVQLYNRAKYCYQPKEAKDVTIAVGTSFFIQYDAVQSVKLSPATTNTSFLAPLRSQRTTSEFRLAMTSEEGEKVSDHLWVSASEEATGEYVIGHDLLKMGTPSESKIAQVWAKQNSNRLCDIEMPLDNNGAHCDLGIFAPQARTYSLAVEKAPQDVVLYLTYNGRPIWNLTMSPYEFDLEQGTTEGYGLQLYVRQAPEVATGVDGVQDAEIGARKVLINDKIYLITPEGAIFSVTGKKIQ